MNLLDPHERVEADDGYRHEAPEKVRCPKCITVPQERKRMMAIVRMRHETINRRVKQWRCLKGVFRHDLDYHTDCFTAVCVLTQLAISNGEPLFQVDYSDNLDVSDEESGSDDDGESDSDNEEESDSEEEEEEEEQGDSDEEDEEEQSDSEEEQSDSEEE